MHDFGYHFIFDLKCAPKFDSAPARFQCLGSYTADLPATRRRWRPLSLLCGPQQSVCFSHFKPAGRSKGMYLLRSVNLMYPSCVENLQSAFRMCRVCYQRVSGSQSYAATVTVASGTCTTSWWRRRCK